LAFDDDSAPSFAEPGRREENPGSPNANLLGMQIERTHCKNPDQNEGVRDHRLRTSKHSMQPTLEGEARQHLKDLKMLAPRNGKF